MPLVQDLVSRHHIVRCISKVDGAFTEIDEGVVCSRKISARDHGTHARQRFRGRSVDRLDSGMCMRAPENRALQESGELDVSSVNRPTGDLVVSVVTDRTGPDYVVLAFGGFCCHRDLPRPIPRPSGPPSQSCRIRYTGKGFQRAKNEFGLRSGAALYQAVPSLR